MEHGGNKAARIEKIASKVRANERVTGDEALELYRHAPTFLLGRLADAVRARKHPQPIVTYIIDRNVNYTNVCVAKCNFCAFYRPVGSTEGYVLGFDELFRKIDETIEVGGVQLLLQGGHNPDLPLSWYDILLQLREAGGRLRMQDLAARLVLPRSSLTRQIDRMQSHANLEAAGETQHALFSHARKNAAAIDA